MAKGTKKWVKPGFLANQKVNEYEMLRNNKVKYNEQRVQALGLKHIPTTLSGFVQWNGKETMVDTEDDENDDDFNPANEKDDGDHDSDDSFDEAMRMQDVPQVQHGTLYQPAPASNEVVQSERATRSTTQPNLATPTPQSLHCDPENEASHSEAPISKIFVIIIAVDRPRRGPTRGIMVQQIFDKEGKLLVHVPPHFRAPVGKYANKLATKIGVEVRTNLEDIAINRWKAADESVKAPMLQRIQDRFYLEGDPMDIDKAMATQFGRKLSDYTHKLYKKYKQLKETKGELYARSHPPCSINHEKWIGLIDRKWSNPKFLDKSVKNSKNRSNMKSKHRCGSKSIPVRVHAMMEANENRLPELKEVYKSTHYNEQKKMWISEESKENYERILEVERQHYSEPGATLMTQEELSIKSLKAKSGYVKGLGMRPSSSLRKTVASEATREYVTHLESLVEEQREEIQAHKQKIDEQQEEIQVHKEKIDVLSESNKQMELTTKSIVEFLKQQGNGFNEYIASSMST